MSTMSHFGSNLFLTTFAILLLSALLSTDHHSRIVSHLSNIIYTNKDSYSNYDQDKQVIPIVGAVGPESLAFDPHGGGPYTGVSDGRIIKWLENERRWIDFAVTSTQRDECEGSQVDHQEQREHICGRPLGLRFDERTGNLYIADAYMGLLVVGPEGGLATKVSTQAHGISFGFTNSLDIDNKNGIVYFSDSSSRFQRRNHISVIVSGDRTGRLMKYNPQTNETTVLLQNLTFPNGVSLSKDGDFILVADTTNCRILKLWLEPSSKSRVLEVFAQLPGFPDNIKRNHRGEFWVGIHAKRGKFLKWVLSMPLVGQTLIKLPLDITKVYSYFARWGGNGLAVRLSGDGDVLEVVEDESRISWKAVSEVEERDGNLWIGSVRTPFVGIQRNTR